MAKTASKTLKKTQPKPKSGTTQRRTETLIAKPASHRMAKTDSKTRNKQASKPPTGQQCTPAKVLRMPHFPHLKENNVRMILAF